MLKKAAVFISLLGTFSMCSLAPESEEISDTYFDILPTELNEIFKSKLNDDEVSLLCFLVFLGMSPPDSLALDQSQSLKFVLNGPLRNQIRSLVSDNYSLDVPDRNRSWLNLNGSEDLTDFDKLAQYYKQLKAVYADNTKIKSIKPLAQLRGTMHNLSVCKTALTSLEGIEELSGLCSLDAAATNIDTCKYIRKLHSLHSLDLSDSKDLTKEQLDLLFDTPERFPYLLTLKLNRTAIDRIDHIVKACPSLRYLEISGTKVSDISPLKQGGRCSMSSVDISHTQVNDLSALLPRDFFEEDYTGPDNHNTLTSLDITGTPAETNPAFQKLVDRPSSVFHFLKSFNSSKKTYTAPPPPRD